MRQEQKITKLNNEITVLSDIVIWSEKRCAWQRDALRRLNQSGKLTSNDLDALVEICKDISKQFTPLTHNHVRNPKASSTEVNLKSICSVENVNALASNQKLRFSEKGITVVYGDNGSGKSGYIRILKRICRARDPKASTILPNIYNSQSELPKAKIFFSVGKQNKTVEWVNGQTMEKVLPSISVFDANTANIHVDEKNDVAYIPFPMVLLSKLADACKEVKNILQKEIDVLISQTPNSIKNPECKSFTEVGKIIANLQAGTDPYIIERLATLTKDEEKRLNQLQTDLTNNSTLTIKNLNLKLTQINNICQKADQLSCVITTEQYLQLKALNEEFLTRKQAAELASNNLFKDEPIPNIGNSIWKTLWEAARRYSQSIVYIGNPFPVTDNEARCVLCQQELGVNAKERLTRFEAFVTDETKKQEEKALKNLQNFHQRLSAEQPSLKDISDFIYFCKDEFNNENFARNVRVFFIKGKWRLRAVLRLQNFLPDAPVWTADVFNAEKAQIIKLLSELDNTDEARQKLIIEKLQLENRKWLSVVKADVLAEIERKSKIQKLNNLINEETSTTSITAKSTSICESLITSTMREQFAQEVEKMKLSGLDVELKQASSSYGVPQFKVSLRRNPNVKVGQVLSEGEFRCIALAAFLAELATTQSKSAIVFDDPVSSLDHIHREAVAQRLVNEGLSRQIIVFTHDIHFLFLLEEFNRKNKTEIIFRHVTKRPDGTATGFCHDGVPPKARAVEQHIKSLEKHLKNIKFHHERGNETEWDTAVKYFQCEIRIMWKRAVEDFVGKVVTRFSNKVETKELSSLTVLTLEDCNIMRNAYSRCSKWVHSSGVGLNLNPPTAKDIENEINILKYWYNNLQNKQKAIKQ